MLRAANLLRSPRLHGVVNESPRIVRCTTAWSFPGGEGIGKSGPDRLLSIDRRKKRQMQTRMFPQKLGGSNLSHAVLCDLLEPLLHVESALPARISYDMAQSAQTKRAKMGGSDVAPICTKSVF